MSANILQMREFKTLAIKIHSMCILQNQCSDLQNECTNHKRDKTRYGKIQENKIS